MSGGFIKPALRGTSSAVMMHVVDWYVALSVLVGVNPADRVHINGE